METSVHLYDPRKWIEKKCRLYQGGKGFRYERRSHSLDRYLSGSNFETRSCVWSNLLVVNDAKRSYVHFVIHCTNLIMFMPSHTIGYSMMWAPNKSAEYSYVCVLRNVVLTNNAAEWLCVMLRILEVSA